MIIKFHICSGVVKTSFAVPEGMQERERGSYNFGLWKRVCNWLSLIFCLRAVASFCLIIGWVCYSFIPSKPAYHLSAKYSWPKLKEKYSRLQFSSHFSLVMKNKIIPSMQGSGSPATFHVCSVLDVAARSEQRKVVFSVQCFARESKPIVFSTVSLEVLCSSSYVLYTSLTNLHTRGPNRLCCARNNDQEQLWQSLSERFTLEDQRSSLNWPMQNSNPY